MLQYKAEGWESTIVNDGEGNTLCVFPGKNLKEAKHNAQLFAAAPGLLKLAQELDTIILRSGHNLLSTASEQARLKFISDILDVWNNNFHTLEKL